MSEQTQHAGERGDSNPLAALRAGADQLLDLFYERIGRHHEAVSGHVAPGDRPPAEVSGSDEDLRIALEVPGLDESDIEVLVEDDMLVIRGEKSESKERKGADYILRERSYGRFERRFTVPSYVDAGKARARCDRGVLTVTLPRKPGEKRRVRKIPVMAPVKAG